MCPWYLSIDFLLFNDNRKLYYLQIGSIQYFIVGINEKFHYGSRDASLTRLEANSRDFRSHACYKTVTLTVHECFRAHQIWPAFCVFSIWRPLYHRCLTQNHDCLPPKTKQISERKNQVTKILDFRLEIICFWAK